MIGLGGVFFESENPAKLNSWYKKHLGFKTGEYGTNFSWRYGMDGTRTGYTQWVPCERDAEHFHPSDKRFMMSYRVHDLEALVEQLEASGISLLGKVTALHHGKFAYLLDPEGNKVELWEPNDTEYARICEGVTG